MNTRNGLKRKRSLKQRRLSGSRRSGQVLIEMAASIFLLLAILMGVMEFGWLITRTYAVGNATREGARYAALGHSTNSVKQRVIHTGNTNFIVISDITIQYCTTTTTTTNGVSTTTNSAWTTIADSDSPNTVAAGNQIRVTVTVAHKPLTGFFPFLKRNITQFTVMRREL